MYHHHGSNMLKQSITIMVRNLEPNIAMITHPAYIFMSMSDFKKTFGDLFEEPALDHGDGPFGHGHITAFLWGIVSLKPQP